MTLLEAINQGWGWSGLVATQVHAKGPMGHLLVSDAEGCFHYIDIDMMELHALGNEAAARAHFAKPETRELWEAAALVEPARARLGNPPDGSVFALNIHAMLAGNYSADEVCFLPLHELAFLSGDLARQLKDLPEGEKLRIEIID